MALIERVLTQAVTAVYGFKNGERGQGMAEYGLILALVAVAVIATLTLLGTGISGTFTNVTAKL